MTRPMTAVMPVWHLYASLGFMSELEPNELERLRELVTNGDHLLGEFRKAGEGTPLLEE